jgi:hypothetical protein
LDELAFEVFHQKEVVVSSEQIAQGARVSQKGGKERARSQGTPRRWYMRSSSNARSGVN